MTTPRSVKFELLRHGPPHNQLLSPLTDYMALCGNHSPATVRMPFEHSQLLNRLRVLRYEFGMEDKPIRDHHLQDMAAIVGRDILGKVPGLIAELSDPIHQGCVCDGERFTHFRLIVSASELALIPFELAISSEGFSGAGQSLLLQTQSPLCLTREVRRVGNSPNDWPQKPKILFVAASPGGGEIPFDAHLLALRQAIDPWVTKLDPKLNDAERLSDHLVVLPNASISQIRDACRHHSFSYVHILAHGANYQDADDKRFGLALHSDSGESSDVVDGVRLAAALRTCPASGGSQLSNPTVVTVASCDSGNAGTVFGTGASVAHALHENRIPLVIASQFPLTFAGSVIMTEVVYDGLLWGIDPRQVLFCLRRDLRARLKESHDWASIVTYAALPEDIASEMRAVRMKQANDCVCAGFDIRDQLDREDRPGEGVLSNEGVLSDTDCAHWKRCAAERIQKGIRVFNDLLHRTDQDPIDRQIRLLGMLASAEKRAAEYRFRGSDFARRLRSNPNQGVKPTGDDKRLLAEVRTGLERSRDRYDEAFRRNRSDSWALVQSLVLTAVLDGPESVDTNLWVLAECMSRNDLSQSKPDERQRGWAVGNLIELNLLRMATQPAEAESANSQALDYSKQLAKFGKKGFVYTQRRQIQRYQSWFGEFQKATEVSEAFVAPAFQAAVKEILKLLPEHADVDWSQEGLTQ